jgi:hypothetical protein
MTESPLLDALRAVELEIAAVRTLVHGIIMDAENGVYDDAGPKQPEGFCPTCDQPIVGRERSPDGSSWCAAGHKMPHSAVVWR